MKGKWACSLATATPTGFILPPPSGLSREWGNRSRFTGPGCPTPSLPITCLLLPLLQLHYQYQVVQSLHGLWNQYMTPASKAKEVRPGEEERLNPRSWIQSGHLEKAPALESQVSWQENVVLGDSQDSFRPQQSKIGAMVSQQKSIMEELLVEGSRDLEGAKSLRDLEGLLQLEWNLCLEDFRKVLLRPWRGGGRGE